MYHLPSADATRDRVPAPAMKNGRCRMQQLNNAVFTALPGTSTLDAWHFVIGSRAGDADDFIIYNSGNGALLYDNYGNGPGAAVEFARLYAPTALALVWWSPTPTSSWCEGGRYYDNCWASAATP